ncbi:MAG: hypothetical protein Q9178_001802 [Gyalolechia marmorata]
MLLAQTLVRLLELWDQGHITLLPTALLQNRLPVTLIQLVTRTLENHTSETLKATVGSMEILAYAILTLKALYSLPWFGALSEEILSRIQEIQAALDDYGAASYEPQYVWVEKVTYGSFFLSEAYFLAAMRPTKPAHVWTEKVLNLVPIVPVQEKNITHMFRKLRCFEPEPIWKVRACVLEGLMFLPQLRSSYINILAGEKIAKNEYLSFIPCMWVVINYMRKLDLETNLLWDMMVLTLGNFRVDEWMESVTRSFDVIHLSRAKDSIRSLCERWHPEEHAYIDGTFISLAAEQSAAQQSTDILDSASLHATLTPYISTVIGHPRIIGCSTPQLQALRTALHTFLNAHIDQTIANLSLSAQAGPSLPFEDFSDWLRSISAPSVSAPFSFEFLTCLMGGLPPDPVVRYLSQEYSAHIAVMSRMYNDLGSLMRDTAEQNVNCCNFFFGGSTRGNNANGSRAEDHLSAHAHGYNIGDETDEQIQLASPKTRLETLAAYERDAADLAGARLVSALLASGTPDSKGGLYGQRKRKRWANAVRLFSGVAELYADIYLVKDLSNRQQDGEGPGRGLKRKRGHLNYVDDSIE